MKTRFRRSVVLVVAAGMLIGYAEVASAQQQQAGGQEAQQAQDVDPRAVARTFAELNARLKPGSTVFVTREAGERTKARVQGFDADLHTLFLTADGTSFGMTEDEVRQLSVREQDSLVNGAVIGACVGGGLFVIAGIACALVDGCGAASETFAAAAVFGGIGAGIGVGIDAMVKTERLVYVSPVRGGFSVGLAPVVSSTGKGVRVVLRF